MNEALKYHQFPIDLTSNKRRFNLSLISALGAFLILIVFEPFGIFHSSGANKNEVFIELAIAVLIAFAILIGSQFGIRTLFKIYKFKPLPLVLWFMFEAVMVASLWTIVDYFNKQHPINFIASFAENLVAYSLIFILPYASYIASTIWKDTLDKYKEKQTAENKQVEDILFQDSTGSLKLAIKKQNLLFIQSSDNYVEISFLEHGIPQKYLLRNSIKNIETLFVDTSIIRCHRSFIVNLANIEKATKTTSGFRLRIQHCQETDIPVSKSYTSEFTKAFKIT